MSGISILEEERLKVLTREEMEAVVKYIPMNIMFDEILKRVDEYETKLDKIYDIINS